MIEKKLELIDELYQNSWNEEIGKYFFIWEGIVHEFDTEADMDKYICENILKIKKHI
jgi:hypothetical protein